MLKNHTTYRHIVVFIIAIIAAFFLGYHAQAGEALTPLTTTEDQTQELALSPTEIKVFWDVWKTLEEKYPFESPSSTEKMHGAMQGLAFSYKDPYTVFFPPREAEQFDEDIKGEFAGVGVEIDIIDGRITVVAPLKDTPAYHAGLQPEDIILRVDGNEISNLPIGDVVTMIRGPIGTTVILEIARAGALVEVPIVRDTIRIPTLEFESLSPETDVIRLFSFNEHASQEFRRALTAFNASGKENLVIDLRGNPGGILEESIAIASMFLPSGTLVVSEHSGEGHPTTEHRSRGKSIVDNSVKVAILVDRGSASASEILAGALQEHDRAILVGDTTFGKGSVQELVHFADKSSLKVTIAEWLTPDGTSISEAGLTPDTIIQYDPEHEGDNQQEEAVRQLENPSNNQ